MGIRYYGWAITSDEVSEASDNPWQVIRRADRRHHLPGWTNTDFDKAWSLMQRLFSGDWPQRRPAYDLVAGQVTYPEGELRGYEPYVGVLTPDRVRTIADDVAAVSREDVRRCFAELCYDDDLRRQKDQEYVAYHLGVAESFTADAAARGHGIVYMIG